MVSSRYGSGFTLIELSIVLVIIGLIVGGVLVGQDLIRAAYIRAQLTQIEKFNTAVNTFYGKYQALPGDMNSSTANTYNFPARGQYAGEGDGNGIIEGIYANSPNSSYGEAEGGGETLMFWSDLAFAGLIPGGFIYNDPTTIYTTMNTTQLPQFFPAAALGGGAYIHIYSASGVNWYNITGITSISGSMPYYLHNYAAVTVNQAYSIDKKVDDGYPESGRVLAIQDNSYCSPYGGTERSVAFGPSATICYDDDNLTSETPHYTMDVNNGAAKACNVGFQFQ